MPCADDQRSERLVEVEREMEMPTVWDDPERAQALGKERSDLDLIVRTIDNLTTGLSDAESLLEMAVEEDDADTVTEIESDLSTLDAELEKLEFRRMFSGEMDPNNAYLEIQAGSGGTEAQDWAEMMLRMYISWAQKNDYTVDLLDRSDNDEAGINNASIAIRGPMAYGYLKSESGLHRLVRISPFNSEGKRQTSFAAVDVTPEVSDSAEIDIDEKDVRVDTFRASGAGGQHVNKTDSAVRLRHLPTGIVVECQNERSQHKNRATAWKMLRAQMARHLRRLQR